MSPVLRRILLDPPTAHLPNFDATEVSGLLTYFDPLDISTLFQEIAGTTPVTALDDPVGHMSGLIDAVSSADDTTRPTYDPTGMNGLPAIKCTGASNQKLTVNALSASLDGADANFTVVMEVSITTLGANQTFFSAGRAASGNPFIIERANSNGTWGSLRRDDAALSASVTVASPKVSAGVPVVYAARHFGTTRDTWINFRKAEASPFDVDNLTLDRVTLGALGTNSYSQFITGYIGRVAVYDNAISDKNLIGLINNFKIARRMLGT